MKFITQRKKLKKISNNIISNLNDISQQEISDIRINNESNSIQANYNLLKRRRDISTDWQLISVGYPPIFDASPWGIFRYSNHIVEIHGIPEKWIPYLKTELIYRYQNSEANEDYSFIDNLRKNIFIQVFDIEGTTTKNIRILGGILFWDFFPTGTILNKEIETKMQVILQSPHHFI